MPRAKNDFDALIADRDKHRKFEREAVALAASENICRLMHEQGISRVELARRIGTSKSHVSQLLDGSRNMTLSTLADLAFALGHKIQIDVDALEGVFGDRQVGEMNYVGTIGQRCLPYRRKAMRTNIESNIPIAA